LDLAVALAGFAAGVGMATRWEGSDLCKLGSVASWLGGFVACRRALDLPPDFLANARWPLTLWIVGGLVLMSPVLDDVHSTRASGYGSVLPNLLLLTAGGLVVARAWLLPKVAPEPPPDLDAAGQVAARRYGGALSLTCLPLCVGLAAPGGHPQTVLGIVGLSILAAGLLSAATQRPRVTRPMRGGLRTYQVVTALGSLVLCLGGSLLYTLRFPELGLTRLLPRWPALGGIAILMALMGWSWCVGVIYAPAEDDASDEAADQA